MFVNENGTVIIMCTRGGSSRRAAGLPAALPEMLRKIKPNIALKVFIGSPNEIFYIQISGLIFLKISLERCSLAALMDNPDSYFHLCIVFSF